MKASAMVSIRETDSVANTAPSEMRRPLCFVLASCQYPAGLLDGTPLCMGDISLLERAGPADRSLALLCQAFPPAQFAIFTGDQVYVDATAGLFDPSLLSPQSPWDVAYRNRDENPAWQTLIGKMGFRCFALLDDHEINDNWSAPSPPSEGELSTTDPAMLRRDIALERFRQEQISLWPVQPPENQLWLSAVLHGHPFFLADTRSERAGRTLHKLHQAEIMHQAQKNALEHWVTQVAKQPQTPAFLVSSSAVLPRTRQTAQEPTMALYADSWSGYPASLAWLLGILHKHRASNVVLLSGDHHVSSLTTITLTSPNTNAAEPLVIYAIHSSALYAPYPFANAHPRDFCEKDVFTLMESSPSPLKIQADTEFFKDDGFAVIEAHPQKISIRFIRHGDDEHQVQHAPVVLDVGGVPSARL